MDRKGFLKTLGLSSGAILATYCFGALEGCTHPEVNMLDFTIDLNDSTYAALNTVGGYVRLNNVVIAQVAEGDYVAVTQKCSHEGKKEIIYRSGTNEFYCTAHGARYSTSGTGKNSLGKKNIAVYSTELSGTNLRVFA